MKAVVGLGNPGPEYALTRHNLGFMVVDLLAQRWGARWRPGRGDYWEAEGEALLVKPTTFMNLSGIAVRQLAERYGLEPEEILVIVDDVNLPFGRLRLRTKGSSGGHRGLESIIFHLGTENFPRLRVGIGPKPEGLSLADFVLSEFTEEERKNLPKVLEAAAQGAELWLRDPERASSFCGQFSLGG